MAEAFPGSSSAQISTMDNENEVPNALAVPDSGDEGNSSSSSSTTESYNATAALSFRTSGPSSPGPVILDYSFSGLETNDFGEALENQPSRVFKSVETILAANNSLIHIPDFISRYTNLRQLDLSNNQLTDIPDVISLCKNLTTFIARNNLLDEHSFPKNIKNLTKLKELNLSGNLLTRIPYEVLEVSSLQSLHLGANHIEFVTKDIKLMKKLEVLYLGGNQISELPFEIGELVNLKVFVLCENRLECLPKSVSTLKHLKSLLLHRNQLTALPVELIKLRNLMELSLRENPLVNKFVRDMVFDPPSLMELAARTIKLRKIPFKNTDLPKNLVDYLKCAHQCVNPRCKGVFFDTRVEHIKFVDFCGKYRIPLLEYLCSPKCSDQRSPAHEVSDSDSEEDRIKKVLLG